MTEVAEGVFHPVRVVYASLVGTVLEKIDKVQINMLKMIESS